MAALRWYRDLKTAYKLLLEFGLTTALLATVGIVGVMSMERMESNMTSIYQRDLAGLAAAQEAKLNQAFAARSVQSVLLAKDNTEAKKHMDDARKYAIEVQANVEKAQRILTGLDERAELARTGNLMAGWLQRTDKMLQLMGEGKLREASEVMVAANGVTFDLRASLNKVCSLTQKAVDSGYTDSVSTFRQAKLTMIWVSLVSVFCSIVLGFIAARSISVPLAQAAAILREVGQGRLTAQVKASSKDEVGQMWEALDSAIATLRQFLKTVSTSALQMAGASRELAAASRNLANGVNQHAAGQEETTVTLEQLSLTVGQNAGNAAQASVLASESQKKAEAGGGVVTSAVAAMDQVQVSSHRIADIISTVDEIAFQTNLLALNAAVEAARAGELGRGFAVVAAEVRSLAQRSAQAAKEIKGLIQDSVLKVDKASELVNRSGKTLAEILQSGNRVSVFVHQIAEASKEQATSITQAAAAVAEMGQVTHGNAAQTEELSVTAHRLSETATQLEKLVQQFVTT